MKVVTCAISIVLGGAASIEEVTVLGKLAIYGKRRRHMIVKARPLSSDSYLPVSVDRFEILTCDSCMIAAAQWTAGQGSRVVNEFLFMTQAHLAMKLNL